MENPRIKNKNKSPKSSGNLYNIKPISLEFYYLSRSLNFEIYKV